METFPVKGQRVTLLYFADHRPSLFIIWLIFSFLFCFFKDNTLKMFKTFLAHTCAKTDSELNYTHSWYSLLTSALDFRMRQMLSKYAH